MTAVMEMKIVQNTIARDWTVLHEGRRFCVNFTESDGQTLVLSNRDNWRICEETEDGTEELDVYACEDDSPEERKRVEENARLGERLIAFCIDSWDNEFVLELQDELHVQRAMLGDG